MKNMSLKTLIATLAIAASSSAMAAQDSPAAQRVQHTVNSHQVIGQPQAATTSQLTFSTTGMSVAAGRVEQALSTQHIQGKRTGSLPQSRSIVSDQGKSAAASRVQRNLSESI